MAIILSCFLVSFVSAALFRSTLEPIEEDSNYQRAAACSTQNFDLEKIRGFWKEFMTPVNKSPMPIDIKSPIPIRPYQLRPESDDESGEDEVDSMFDSFKSYYLKDEPVTALPSKPKKPAKMRTKPTNFNSSLSSDNKINR